jgi:TonB-linked SusC/RagA family outer membrane protein
VFVPGTQFGTLSNAEGRFLLINVPAGEITIRVELIGYGSGQMAVTVTAAQAAVVDFQLQPQAVALEELVVTGYGTQRREDLTGAVVGVSASEFVQVPALDAASLVKGKIAGLVVNTTTGNPAATQEISLRGFGTLSASTAPLVIVDGVPGNLETVAPQDIESIDVLKDASAAAVYGSRAANGVIFITTKKYEGGGATIRYDGYASVQTLYKMPDFLDASDVERLAREGFTTPAGNTFEDLGYATDWQAEIMRDLPVAQSHNITLMGGEGGTNYTASFSYESTQGIFKKSENNEVTGRVNIGHSMYDGKLTTDLNLVSRWETRPTGVNLNYMWRQASIRNPTDRIYDDDGNWQTRGTYFYTNPVQMLGTYGGDYESRDLRLHGTVTFRPIESFAVSLLTGTERGQNLSGTYRTLDNPDVPGINSAGQSTRSDESKILELTGTYADVFGGHQITLLGGYEYYDRLSESFDADNERFPTDLFGYSRLEAGAGLPEGLADMGSGKSLITTIGFFGRLNWDWNNRFLAMASMRYEGDSRFGANYQWGVFPGLQLGWRLSEESFLQGYDFINDLKLRVGWGVTGIAPSSPYQSLTTYQYSGNYPVGGQWVQGLVPGQNPNPELKWERKTETNFGLDFSVMDYRLAGSLDIYRRDTRDMLYNYDVPVPPFLYGSMLANVGHMRNSGVEASLTYDVVRSADFRWRASGNFSTNNNELVSLSNDVYEAAECFYPGHTGEPIQITTHRVCIGGPIGNFYGFHSVDITPEGEWIITDSLGANPMPYGEGNNDDRMVLGNGVPDFYLAFNNSLQWRNFDLNVNMRGAFGHQILNYGRLYYENLNNTQYNMLNSAFDKVYGKALLDYPLVYVDYYLEDGDYWKVDNATLGYTFDAGSLPGFMSTAVQSARIYLAGRNLLTLTGYKGLDPEVTTTGLSPGQDQRDQYPTTRTFTVGMNLVF